MSAAPVRPSIPALPSGSDSAPGVSLKGEVWRQLRRDRMTIAMMVVVPLMQLMLFGYAINTDVRHMPTIVYDQDRSPESRDLYRSLEATGFYDIIGEVRDYDEVERAMLEQRILQLKIEHRDLDDVIKRLADHTVYDQVQLQRLKRRKLLLKDQIAWLERQVDPDIPA